MCVCVCVCVEEREGKEGRETDMAAMYVLFESASGYAVFDVEGLDDFQRKTNDGAKSITSDYERFSRVVKLSSFKPFSSAAEALQEANAVSESIASEFLVSFLEMALPRSKKGFRLGVSEPKLGSAVQDKADVKCVCNDAVIEVLRGIRCHFHKLQTQLKKPDVMRGQLGLAHSYSRAKVKFNVHKVDNMIIQSIALLDTLDKDVNTFVMRVREWYSWHFPELVKIVPDNYMYAKLAKVIKDKSEFAAKGDEAVPELVEVLGDEERAMEVLDAARTSMGQDISPVDLVNIETFADRVISLAEYRASLHAYLVKKMFDVAPNLSTLIGETVGARLISHAGSLTNLAKYPASTVQILGAEKALFRALKTKGNTPKYGLLFNSSFIGRAQQKNKGRISRYLANKCSIASRIDAFADVGTVAFGEKLKEQVEERLSFYDKGAAPRKNVDVMGEAMRASGFDTLGDAGADDEPMSDADSDEEVRREKKKKKKDKKKVSESDEEEDEGDKKEKKKKKKKSKTSDDEDEEATKSAKKKKKKRKNDDDDEDDASAKKKKKKKKDDE